MDIEKEHRLIEKIIEGEYDLYSQLIKEYQDKLITFIYKIVRNEEDAMDIAQDTFLKAYKSIKSFRFKAKFSTWLFQIGYNNSINFIKRNKKMMEIEKKLEIPPEYENHENNIEKEELSFIIEKILKEIKGSYSATLHLFYKEEKSYKEIAEIMKIPINSVKSNILRGKEMIKQKLKDEYNIEGLNY